MPPTFPWDVIGGLAGGVVQAAGFSTDGYGNKVVINHGFGFQTLYAHMVRVKAKLGQSVKRVVS